MEPRQLKINFVIGLMNSLLNEQEGFLHQDASSHAYFVINYHHECPVKLSDEVLVALIAHPALEFEVLSYEQLVAFFGEEIAQICHFIVNREIISKHKYEEMEDLELLQACIIDLLYYTSLRNLVSEGFWDKMEQRVQTLLEGVLEYKGTAKFAEWVGEVLKGQKSIEGNSF